MLKYISIILFTLIAIFANAQNDTFNIRIRYFIRQCRYTALCMFKIVSK